MAHLPIWYLDQFSIEDCEKAFDEYIQLTPKDAAMGKDGDTFDHSFRNTKVRFASSHTWFGLKMFAYANTANQQCKWGYDINQFETVQFAEYNIGQKYDWHVDNFPLSGSEIDRKITVVCLMSDPDDFEGGELILRLYNEYTPPLKKGSVIAFPSIIEHKVTPVTKGVRYSATMWISGPRFK